MLLKLKNDRDLLKKAMLNEGIQMEFETKSFIKYVSFIKFLPLR